ncbi:LamG-like jellyroll fold domain-containing protein [Planctomycetota bacterium]
MGKKWNIVIVLWVFMLALPAVAGLTASNPSPTPGQIITDVNTNLTWTAGTQAGSHNVYFGTDFDDVNNTGLVGNLADGQWIDFADVKIIADHWLTDSNFPGLVSRWALDGDANDSIGGIDGTVQGDPVWINGIVAGGLDLDGDDYIDCGSDSSLDLTNNFTIALWIKAEGGVTILCKGDVIPTQAGGAYSISSDGSSNCIFILRDNTDTAPALVFAPMNFGQWAHIAATFSNGSMTVYTDGSQANTGTLSTTTVNTNTEPLAIGAEAGGQNGIIGSIDDVRIYNNVLSAADILTLGSLPRYGDLNGDGRIDSVDYSIQADNWKKRRDAAVFMGNHDTNSFDPGVLDEYEITYYWRIDEINGFDVWKGDVWDFVVADDWEMSEFMIMLGWPSSVSHPSPATLIQAMAADSFNTVMWGISLLEITRDNGMKLMVMPSNPAIAADLAFDSAVWGYHIVDEPSAPYTGIPETVAALHQVDPTHPAMVNLSGGINYHPDFIDLVNPEILSYTGSYQWRPGRRGFTRIGVARATVSSGWSLGEMTMAVAVL